ncbi:ATP-binding protein [Bacillus andreraoultii]|uniref:ATP-binding protein n=1 Tax=Bacillus andreraoultii TaxID=1499685 RepID=UPI00053A402B|nr:ATP-binding protein [Bacillus andreraoultii]
MIDLPNGTKAQMAEYNQHPDIIEYQNNPLIEALPPIYSQSEVIDRLSIYPPYNKEEKNLENYKRVHLILRLLHYFQPIPIHLTIESSISRLIRAGYIHRNPLTKEYTQGFVDNWNNIKEGKLDYSLIQTGQTLSIVGVSGVGKTRTMQRILQMMPQVISHVDYKGKPLNQYQVTFLKIETPFDGSVKTIIFDFMYQVDLLLGTSYFNRYANSRLSTSQLMPIMAQIAKSINLGVLLIDELQHLKGMKNSNSVQVLNFFTALINTINIPLIMVGTPKAMDVLQSQFRQARRNTNMGSVFWDRLEKDAVWDLFIQGMWQYQWTKEDVEHTDELSALMYEVSQGIADIAIKLFMMVQHRAIITGKERITPKLIKLVAEEDLKMVQPMLQALRSKNYSRLSDYDDLVIPDIKEYFKQEKIESTDKQQILKSLQQGVQRKSDESKLINEAVFRLEMLGFNNNLANETVQKILSKSGTLELSVLVQMAFSMLNESGNNEIEEDANDLRVIIQKGKEEQISAYESLLNADLIKSDYSIHGVTL